MKTFLVGYTGFVGSNLCHDYNFDALFNSKNIEDAYDQNPDLLVYAGVPAQKFLANQNPLEDKKIIENAIYNIKKIKPKKVILISTIDVYKNPNSITEDEQFLASDEAYGKNRLYLEEWVKNNFTDYLIVRLPALYGDNLKKNFIFDLINFIPKMIKEDKFLELSSKNDELKQYYLKMNNGFYKLKDINLVEENKLKKILINLNFSALNFTDSRNIYQFYNLKYLWKHIEIALKNNINIINIATEPITINELYQYIYNEKFTNILNNNISNYNFKTKYAELYNGKNGYIFNKKFILKDIKRFVLKNTINSNLCISNIAWVNSQDEQMYKYLKDKHIKYIEIAPTRIIDNPYKNIKKAIKITDNLKKNYGIEVKSMQSIWFGKTENIFESEKSRLELIDYTKKAIDFAKAINCTNLVFGNPKNRNMNDSQKNTTEALNFFREIGKYALEKNIIIAIEPNPTIYNTNFLNTTKEAIEFVKKINMPSIKINYDLGTVIANKEDLKILEENLKYINNIHISEPFLNIIKKRNIHKKVIKILKQKNYQHIISIEMAKTDISNIKNVIEYFEEIYWSIYEK